ncbi:MAG: hypothetical protein PHQ66_00765 [Candidatus Nanoarchaeia archaeon]|nr:hypothetical protein [Candidatus Nanoarchaeia archaeon]MDD5358490.1 hypothetical protein [Candidatus Nanoarchaeia archaeon]MDD5589004.1 hypothetical protein [Candidatus Nanoarchaeia archaeon]
MKNLSKKMSEEYRREVFDKLMNILVSQNPWIKDRIKFRGEITEDTRFQEDLELDKKSMYAFTEEVTEKFKVYIPKEKIEDFKIVRDYMDEIALIDCTSNKT